MRFWRFVFVGLLLILACGFVSATGQPEGPIVLKYMTPQVGAEAAAKTIEAMVNEFNTDNAGKIRVDIEGIPDFTTYLTALKTKVAAGIGPDAFYYNDIITTANFWGKGQLADLTPYVDQEFKNQDYEQDWAECVVGGKILAFPYQKLTTALFYNKDIFAKAGVSTPIANWDEMQVACQKIKAAGYIPFAMMTQPNAWCPMLMYSAYVGSAGGPDVFKGITDLKNPVFLDAARFLKAAWAFSTSDAIGSPYAVAANNFISGKAAMIANGPWMITDLKKAEGFYAKVGYMPYPGVAGKGMIVQAGPVGKMSTFVKNESQPTRMKAIVKFFKFTNGTDSVKRLIRESGSGYAGKVSFTEKDNIEPLLRELYRFVDTVPWTVNYMNAALTPPTAVAFAEELENLWSGATTPEQFVGNLERKAFAK